MAIPPDENNITEEPVTEGELTPEEFESRLLGQSVSDKVISREILKNIGEKTQSDVLQVSPPPSPQLPQNGTPAIKKHETIEDRLARMRKHYDESYEQYCGNPETLGNPQRILAAIHRFKRDHVSWAATEGRKHDRYNRIEDGKTDVKGLLMFLPSSSTVGKNLILATDPRVGVNIVRIGDFDISKKWATVMMNVALGILHLRAKYPEKMKNSIDEEHYTQTLRDTGTKMAVLDIITGKSLMTMAGNHLYRAGVIIKTDEVRPGFRTPDDVVKACRNRHIAHPFYLEIESLLGEPPAGDTEKNLRQSFCIHMIALYLISIMEMANRGEQSSAVDSDFGIEVMRKLELSAKNDRHR